MTEQRYALLIGNSEFPNETGLTPLRCPPRDVQGLTKVLAAADRGQFQVTPLINQTKREIETQLVRTLNKVSKEDLVLIYFSGHGRPSNLEGKLYLVAQDTELDLLQATAIAARQLKAFIDDSHCSRIILILDCCYSGAIDDAFLKGEKSGQVNQTLTELAKNEGHGLHIMTASTAIQTAEEKQGDEYSVFTKHLINGISTGVADKHAKGVISFNDLFDYIEQELKAESEQKPQIFNLGGGDLWIAYSGKSSRKERREMIKPFLLGLLNERRLTAKVHAEAVAILESPEARLTELERHRDVLLGELYAREMESAEFVEEWAVAGVTKNIVDTGSNPTNKNSPSVVKETVTKILAKKTLILENSAKEKLTRAKIAQEKSIQETLAKEKIQLEKAAQEKLAKAKIEQKKAIHKEINKKTEIGLFNKLLNLKSLALLAIFAPAVIWGFYPSEILGEHLPPLFIAKANDPQGEVNKLNPIVASKPQLSEVAIPLSQPTTKTNESNPQKADTSPNPVSEPQLETLQQEKNDLASSDVNKQIAAVTRFTEFANDGNAEAMYQLGMYYFRAEKLQQGDKFITACNWYQKAIDNGYEKAQERFNKTLCKPEQLEKWQQTKKDLLSTDPKKQSDAVTWFTELANAGNSETMYQLGMYYFHAGNHTAACNWYKKSIDNGHQKAKERYENALCN